MADDYSVLDEAARVADQEAKRVGLPRDTFYAFETLYTVRRALLLATIFPRATTPVDGWIAQIRGPSREHGLDRVFLPKCWRVLRTDALAARDCRDVRAGDVLECHRDHGARFTKKFLRITAITDAGIFALTMSEEEVAALYHGERR